MKYTWKIVKTNYINIIGIFFSVLVYCVGELLITKSWPIFQILRIALFAVLLWGLTAWIIFIICVCALDILIISKSVQKNLKRLLILEWLLLSIPFIYFAFKYKIWALLIAVVAFFLSQLVREREIRKIKGFL